MLKRHLTSCAALTVFCALASGSALSNFAESQYRAKRAEVPANVDGIKTAQLGYDAAFDTYLPCERTPQGEPGKEARDWPSTEDFDTLGWAPDGQVRGVYWVTTSWGDGSGDFTVHGISDVDGDGVQAHYTATKSINATLVTPTDVH